MPHDMHVSSGATSARVAVLDDDAAVLGAFARNLRRAGHSVIATADPEELLARVAADQVDVVVTDLFMPGLDGLGVLNAIQERAPFVPVILITGAPTLDSVMRAFGSRAFALLQKPCQPCDLQSTVANAVAEGKARRELRDRRAKSEEHALTTTLKRARDNAMFDEALKMLFMVYQPIVRLSTRSVLGHEALVRSKHPELGNPARLFQLAHELGREDDLARRIRSVVTQPFDGLPPDLLLFLNVLASDLEDETFLAPESPLLPHADRLVLEVSEQARASSSIARLDRCRGMGMRVAIDDLGAGYASLNSVAELEPDVIKLDMVLVRDVHLHPVRQRLVRALVGAAHELGVEVVAEGVETRAELLCLVTLGCDVFQGYLFAKPTPALSAPDFSGAQP